MAELSPFGLTPEEAVRWFQRKGYRLSFDWRDTWKEQHTRAFTVAKMTQLDLLADVRAAVEQAIRDGWTVEQFRKALTPMLQERGWWGEKQMVDPKTGETKMVQLGSARRLRTIYQTNLRQALAAGRWERFERTKAARPYARYVAILDGRERPQHHAWHGTVLPLDDAWWNTHAPPNGWGCRCKLQQLSERDLARYGYSVSSSAPPVTYRSWENARTGQTLRVPDGIDPGFDYNPGTSTRGGGGTPEPELPVLEPVQTFADAGRPPASEVTDRPAPPTPWPRAHSDGERAATIERFRQLFGIPAGHDDASITDPHGEQVLFGTRFLEHVIANGHEQYVPAAKATVEQPYEIWLVPFKLSDGTVVMRKRYIGLFAGEHENVLLVVQRQGDGYAAWTTYARRLIDTKRQGYLLWPRE
jgi:SPP1 gp7 family putative phage head morphogenesis protein